MSPPLISILMPAYNASAFLAQAIECILSQTYQNIELLIADDASTDNTRNLIEAYAQKDTRIKLCHNKTNLGYLKTWNNLIAQAKGDFIAFQDADDFSDLSRLQLQFEFLTRHFEIALVGTNFSYIDARGDKSVSTSQYPTGHEEISKKIPDLIPFCGSSIMIRREVYDTIGGYREYFDRIGAEDYDWILLAMEKFKVANLPAVLYYYRLSQNSVTRTFTYNGRRKLFASQIVKELYEQRQKNGIDYLQTGRLDLLTGFEKKLDEEFANDESHFYWYIGKKLFYEGNKTEAMWFFKQAIVKNPLRLKYYRDYFYFLRQSPPTVS